MRNSPEPSLVFSSNDGDQNLGRLVPGGRRLLSLSPVKAEGDEGASSPPPPPAGKSSGGPPAAGAAAAPAEAPATPAAGAVGGGSIKEAISAFSKGKVVAFRGGRVCRGRGEGQEIGVGERRTTRVCVCV